MILKEAIAIKRKVSCNHFALRQLNLTVLRRHRATDWDIDLELIDGLDVGSFLLNNSCSYKLSAGDVMTSDRMILVLHTEKLHFKDKL